MILYLVILFFILGFIQGEIIKKGQWIIEGRIPNHWMGHAVWGIFCVVTTTLVLGIISLEQWFILFLLFLAAFPGIYLAGLKQWQQCNLGKRILQQLRQLYIKLA